MKAAIEACGFIALLLLALAGPSYRFGLLELGPALSLMRWAVYLGIASIVTVIAFSLWRKPSRRSRLLLAGSALAGLLAAAVPLLQLQKARSVPAIHDISTDTQDPPPFVALLPLREETANPAEYPGQAVADAQHKAYPDLQPLTLDAPLKQVHLMAQQVAKEMGWQIAASNTNGQSAHLEATDTTFWFGFEDDVVVRMHSSAEGTRVDVRSKSRVGKSDLGKNAARIRTFLHALSSGINAGKN